MVKAEPCCARVSRPRTASRNADPGFDLKFLSWSDIIRRTVPPPEFQVENLVPLRGVTLITGEGGIGKSFMLMAMAYATATGTSFLGRFGCRRGGALILDMENDDSTVIRRAQKVLIAHRQVAGRACPSTAESDCGNGESHACDFTLPIHILSKQFLSRVPLLIDRDNGFEALTDVVRFYAPALVVIDPLTAIHATDENDNIAMRQIVMLLQHIARRNNLAIVVIHHPRKRGMINDAGQMIRGASDLRNAVDSHLFMRKLSTTQILVEHDKSRHAPAIERFRVEMTDTNDGTGTIFRYLGDANEPAVKQFDAREAILSALREAGRCKRWELIARAKVDGVSRTVLDRTLKEMIEHGQLAKLGYGVYSLKQPQLEMEC